MRLPRWKKEQKQRKEKKRIYLARRILLVICLTLLLGIGWQVWGSLSKSLWDGTSRLTVAINSTPILVASYEPFEKTLQILAIPPHSYLETIHGYGFYKAESIFKLGGLEGQGGELLTGSLQEYLGVPIDAFASITNNRQQTTIPAGRQAKSKTKDDFLAIIYSLLKGKGETNLTRWDLVRLWWRTRGVRFDKVKLIDLGETNAVEEVTLPDGTLALEPDSLRLDQLVARLFADRRIIQEGLSVGVYNSTGYPGLANKAARLIDNIGGQVIEVGDWDEKNAKCKVQSSKLNSRKYTTQKLKKVFACEYESEETREEMGVDIALILGQDYWQRLQEK